MNMNNIIIFSKLFIQIRLLFIIIPIISINSQIHKNSSFIKNIFSYGDSINLFDNFKPGEINGVKNDDKKRNENEDKKSRDEFYNILKEEFEEVLNKSKVNEPCLKILRDNFLGENQKNESLSKEIIYYNIKKLIDDSSKHKNDLGTYEQCINRRFKINEYFNYNIKDKIKSVYFVITLDESNTTNEETNQLIYPTNTTKIEDIFYVRAFCLPQEQKETTCSNEDYLIFMNEINQYLAGLLGINNKTTYYSLEKDEKSGNIFYLIPLFLGLIQVMLIVLREQIMKICKKCYMRKNNKIKNNNELRKDLSQNSSLSKNNKKEEDDDDDDDDDEEEDDDEEKKEKEEEKNKTLIPHWINIYNKCFNFSENFRELFNFSLNSTNINNDSGLSYIRGLKSSCLFVLILGLTFFILMNSLSKIFSRHLFYLFLKERFFYSFFFVGIRYAPRILFSCSGYTLAYKYLCYINKNPTSFSWLKFIFYQIHKYIILIWFFLYERYSLYTVYNYFSNSESPMLKFLYTYVLSRPEGPKFLLSFLTLSSLYSIASNNRYDQTLIEYFWFPFNEVLFFIVGMGIITIGYKCKLRIDYFILIFVVILYVSKIVYSYIIKSYYGEKYYATLYYYLFDYGKFMLNPMYNLSCYLIGLYFGLINYSVQKGINTVYIQDLFKNKSFKKSFRSDELDLKNINSDEKKKEEAKEDNDEKEKDLNEDLINNSKASNESECGKNNYRSEIMEMPFLIAGVKITNWLRKSKARFICFLMILCIMFFFSIHFIVLYYTFGEEYKKKLEEKNDDETRSKEIDNLLSLQGYITNGFINFIFRIDIEIMIFFVQSLLFICYFKGKNFINDFFCHVFWAMLNKSYFTYILVANPIILFIFYQSETKILLNLFNLILYSLISGCYIFIVASIGYIFFELPYKRLIHYICSDDYNDKDYEQEDDKEEKENIEEKEHSEEKSDNDDEDN